MEVIKVEHLYKQYRLGQVNTGTLSHDLNRWWSKILGKEDPYQKITETNDRTSSQGSDYVWALEDIHFNVQQGDVFGIIGRNGAGKSTLLKLLSKVTAPTKGSITLHGRVASLLEVGTGFHPELTGRENIFLNGAILGMTKAEIRAKFDEIVAFSGVEKYIDTPVKRYSSGMYVRLAFAVAAHLEPEILIIDEVLAVGDAEFQKKCLGKMKEVSGQGRTVIFVSHNMAAVKTLCTKGLVLNLGQVSFNGTASEAVDSYYAMNASNLTSRIQSQNYESAIGGEGVRLKLFSISPEQPFCADDIELNLEFYNRSGMDSIAVSFDILNQDELILFGSGSTLHDNEGIFKACCIIPKELLNNGMYSVNLYVHTSSYQPLFNLIQELRFEVMETERQYGYLGKINGAIRPKLTWK
ncbi:MAG: ATP-binding cassette domain-containing protein [Flavobacteriia bacterium]|nr:ATP-binding cassette domain-containing protein [Flavobacteriia bacterium]